MCDLRVGSRVVILEGAPREEVGCVGTVVNFAPGNGDDLSVRFDKNVLSGSTMSYSRKHVRAVAPADTQQLKTEYRVVLLTRYHDSWISGDRLVLTARDSGSADKLLAEMLSQSSQYASGWVESREISDWNKVDV